MPASQSDRTQTPQGILSAMLDKHREAVQTQADVTAIVQDFQTHAASIAQDFLHRYYSALHGLSQETIATVKDSFTQANQAFSSLSDEARKVQQKLSDETILAKDYISRIHKQFLDEVLGS